MIGYQFQLTNRAGQSVTINDHSGASFIALQEYPVFDVDIKNSEIDKEGQHGIWDFYSFYGKRVLTFSGVIVGTTEAAVEALRTQLLRVTGLPAQPAAGNDGLVLIKWTDAAGNAWQIYAKLERAIRFDRQMKHPMRLDFVMSLKAPDPLIESQTEAVDTLTRGWQTGSLRLPTKLPAKIAPTYRNAVTIANAGTAAADTVIRLCGEAAAPEPTLGSELMTDGNFAADPYANGWYAILDSATWQDSKLLIDGEEVIVAFDPSPITYGKTYRLQFDLVQFEGITDYEFKYSFSAGESEAAIEASGTFDESGVVHITHDFVATDHGYSPDDYLTFGGNTLGGVYFVNVSLKEVTPEAPHGAITNPSIYNTTTGARFTINTTLADDTEWIEIDSKRGTVVNQDGEDLSGLVTGASEYIRLQPGNNTLVYLSDESANAESPVITWKFPTAQATIKHRDATL